MVQHKCLGVFSVIQERALFICLRRTTIPSGIFHFSIFILKLHSTVLHNTAPPHLTSLDNVPSVDTEEGFTQSRPVAVVLLKASFL